MAGQFEVVRLYDGDTLRAIGHDIEIKVRLVGIDAPEIKKENANLGSHTASKPKSFLPNWF
jgi:endonuclease YncB( thermonuclease family)